MNTTEKTSQIIDFVWNLILDIHSNTIHFFGNTNEASEKTHNATVLFLEKELGMTNELAILTIGTVFLKKGIAKLKDVFTDEQINFFIQA